MTKRTKKSDGRGRPTSVSPAVARRMREAWEAKEHAREVSQAAAADAADAYARWVKARAAGGPISSGTVGNIVHGLGAYAS